MSFNDIFSILPIAKEAQAFILGILIGIAISKHTRKAFYKYLAHKKSIKDLQVEIETKDEHIQTLQTELQNTQDSLIQKQHQVRHLQERLYKDSDKSRPAWNI